MLSWKFEIFDLSQQSRVLCYTSGTAMDLTDSIEDAAFRRRVRTFLDANLPQGWGAAGYVPPRGDAYLALLRDWQRRLSEAGFLALAWPTEYGGAGASPAQVAIFNEEIALRDAPQPPNVAGVMLAGPVIYSYGTAEQKRRHLGRIVACEEVWCQGFSEPGAGSDLAALRTRAQLLGDRFIVNGQKVWTSFAHLADWCLLLARTDPGAPKHRGLSILLVNMKAPGVEVRPLRHITGAIEFNELFFNEVAVPRANLVGDLNHGWQIAMATLMNERGGTGLSAAAKLQMTFAEVLRLCRGLTAGGQLPTLDPGLRQRLGQLYVEVQGLRWTAHRALSRDRNHLGAGADPSIIKVLWSELNQRMQEFVMQLQGPASQITADSRHAIENGRWQFELLRSRANTIEMGTSEIHRNTIAERALGLPKSR
ncbi:MAG TPA: acyl-CoA dehydrogenase family protein [Candidatus Binataceae bacterium]|nr:acyl-CoA dehydrogenase family protein [Candidatus Binataceae bacterium]